MNVSEENNADECFTCSGVDTDDLIQETVTFGKLLGSSCNCLALNAGCTDLECHWVLKLTEAHTAKECTCHTLSDNKYLRQRAVIHNPCC